MKVSWLEAFEDGDARIFLEDVAELTEMWKDRGGLVELQNGAARSGRGHLSHAVALRTLLNRALPTLDDAARSELLLDRFMQSLP
ncbi:unnamed protein product [Echinostoma caproni]|uniref:DUF222 domain-containing protein n=1 Tax=Echinostoma caproni TaxID=27848 RepID=A0A183AKZ3_9TREM|nr:unnamed protein product [Echinostoma caproni]